MSTYFAFVIVILATTHITNAITQNSVINCTWPCFDDAARCVVTPEGASCQIAQGDSWILSSPEKAPVFTGSYVSRIALSCIPAPIPQLPMATQNTTVNSNQTVIEWPPWNLRRPLDTYLGNCGHGLYCSSVDKDANLPVCRQRLSVGSTCQSSNQCHYGFCSDYICHPKNESPTNDGHTHHSDNNSRNSDHMNSKTVQILASVFGTVCALLFAGIGFFMYRRHRRRSIINQQPPVYSTSNNTINNSSTSFSVNAVPFSSTGYKEEQFASDFLHEDKQHVAPPPVTINDNNAMRYGQAQADYDDNGNDLLKPPPSYRP
ncbi:DNA repair protein rad14 [Mucor velutinosus]|uniref:DNA repair protein rad14 n=1 Tax=Mucor velutinosus TaxID=708070 RepID=A0AAN7DIZ0_9FUNG|nr:DNA repair protein rad14 [Mucor velutinosus]